MKRLLLLFIFFPVIGFAQGNVNGIQWLEINVAERLSAESDKNMLFFFL